MSNIIVACTTLKDELEKAMRLTGCDYPIEWIDSKYHNVPEQLREKIQEKIDSIEDKENILLVFGCCGNALVGIKATTANLIIPKTDDCISMVLCKQGQKFERPKETYFLTKGWIESSRSLAAEYERAIKLYGLETTQRLFKLALKHYSYLMLIDTNSYNLDEYIDKAKEIAEVANLELTIEDGDVWFIEKLLKGPHDDDFCFISKNEEVTISHFVHDYFEGIQQANLF
mgnify:CR=1 FL=1